MAELTKNASGRKGIRRAVALALALAVAVVGGVVLVRWIVEPKPAGAELVLGDGTNYGWAAAKEVGSRFTDGLNLVTVSSSATGPLRLVSARPLQEGAGLRVLGVLARVVPDMLPAGSSAGWFQDEPNFPPSSAHAAGGVSIDGLVVRVPQPDEKLWIEIQIGYEVSETGTFTRQGVELTYEYAGETRRAVIPSHLKICAPASVACDPDGA